MITRLRRARLTALAAGLSLLLAACTHSGGASPVTSRSRTTSPGVPVVDTRPWSGNQLRFGASPHPDRSITLQPDVVLIGGGADAVRSVSANGFVWTMDPSAAGVAELRVGRIMFATGIGVGRVLALADVPAGTQVVLGPVGLTDIIRSGHLSTGGAVRLSSWQAYTTPNRPGLITQNSRSAAPDALRASPLNAPPAAPATRPPGGQPGPSLGTLPPPSPDPGSLAGKGFVVTPSLSSAGLGVTAGYSAHGLNLLAELHFRASAPKVRFDADVSPSGLTSARLSLLNAAGFSFDLTAGSAVGRSADLDHVRVQVPAEFVVPLTVFGVPLTARLSAAFTLTTVFTAGRSSLTAHASYSFSGAVGFEFSHGHFRPFLSSGVQEQEKLYDGISSRAVGPAGAVLGFAVRLSVGVGLLGFSAGAFVQLALGAKLAAAETVDTVHCRAADVDLEAKVGLDWAVPSVVADVVNFFLRAFHARPIAATGSYSPLPPFVLWQRAAPPAGVAGCVPNLG